MPLLSYFLAQDTSGIKQLPQSSNHHSNVVNICLKPYQAKLNELRYYISRFRILISYPAGIDFSLQLKGIERFGINEINIANISKYYTHFLLMSHKPNAL